ncbi:MAG TPA: hypothetical protein VFA19_13310 [Gaiellaceae bacterium]|nr:hypothetical protein [Gaiellaceae bacterium]
MTTRALAAAATAALLPVPIGVGPRFHPAPAAHGACRPGPIAGGARVHLELFAARRVVIVPAGIGLRAARFRYGRAVAARCRTELWTLDPSGVVHVRGARTLADLFRVWGRALAPDRLLSFRGRVRVYRNGDRLGVDPRRVALRDRDELVLELGPYVPPHRTYRFPP